jgi:hypothetical protein
MIDPCRLSVNGFSEFLLVHLHNKWMSLDPVWLEALAFFLLVAVILPLILELIDQPVDSSFFPPPEGSGDRPILSVTSKKAARARPISYSLSR